MRWRLPVVLAAAVAAASFYAGKRRSEEPTKPVWTSSRLAGLSVGAALVFGAVGYLATSASISTAESSKAVVILQRYGCAGCHAIPGVPNADGRVGPPLAGIKERLFVGGSVRNEPETLANWIVDPPRSNPQSAMPRTGITLGEAGEVVRYLHQY
jgi:mono/diheme cytochrome c family protein